MFLEISLNRYRFFVTIILLSSDPEEVKRRVKKTVGKEVEGVEREKGTGKGKSVELSRIWCS